MSHTNTLSAENLASNQILEIGSGVAAGDIDGDGLVDLYFCSIEGGNHLYRNLGNLRFQEITDASGVACEGQNSTGAAFADVDGDRWPDLLVNAIGGGTRLFINLRDGKFSESLRSGLVRQSGSTSLAIGDVNGDGALDVYVANYHTKTVKDSMADLNVEAGYVNGKFVVTRPDLFQPIALKSGSHSLLERGEPDGLYLNNGNGTFSAVNWTNGAFLDEQNQALTQPPRDWGLAARFHDLNGDNAPDLYVCNDFFGSLDKIWLNDGHGHFHAIDKLAIRHTSMSSMAVDMSDLNRDGFDDILVVDMMSQLHSRRQTQRASLIQTLAATPLSSPLFRPEFPRNTLFINRGNSTFAEIAQYSRLEASEWTWSVAFIDVDLDGFDDVLMTTGTVRDANDADFAANKDKNTGSVQAVKRQPRKYPALESPLMSFRNRGDLTFEECGERWGFHTKGITHGMALADLDNDGDLDVIVNPMRRAAEIYRNNATGPRVAIRLNGRGMNTQGIGASLLLTDSHGIKQRREVTSAGRYLSADDPMCVFAAFSKTNRLTLRITWRTGAVQTLEGIEPGYCYEISEPEITRDTATQTHGASPTTKSTLFEHLAGILRHPHEDPEFNDWERQPLLQRKLSQLGPSVLWYDCDGDGWEDLVVGSGRGSAQVLYLNDRKGGFKALRRRDRTIQDQGALLGYRSSRLRPAILAAQTAYEAGPAAGAAVIQYSFETEGDESVLPAQISSVGTMALGIINDQKLLFVGGRVNPGKFPEPSSSFLLRLSGDRWKIETNQSAAFANLGLVSAALWADLGTDGQPELIVACEWGTIRVFEWTSGGFQERTTPFGFDQWKGGWTGVAAGDFDGDGLLDLLATNWGLNNRYRRFDRKPIRLYYGDFASLGRTELLEAYYDFNRQAYVPFTTLDVMRQHLPNIAARYDSFTAFAQASVEDILADQLPQANVLEMNWLASTVFLNRRDRFEARPLPPEAQFTAAFGASVADFDGDGLEDVFLSQNFLDTDVEFGRDDAGQGLLLRGDGRGGFQAMPGRTIGIQLSSEQRASAVCDFDRDGRPDLVVGQNRDVCALFHNVGGKQGIRVRLKGMKANPDGVGSVIRLRTDKGLGPARAIVAGSGYWSQDSLVQVLSTEDIPRGVWIRWPNGTVRDQTIPSGSRELEITEDPH